MSEQKPEARKTTIIGLVIGTDMKKTVKVRVERQVRHPLYKKIVKKRKNFLVHDEYEKCKVGDVIKIGATRPISKTKRWRVLEIVGLTSTEEKNEKVRTGS
ncbi:MAG: 30S ribosomal protein S17 [Acidobacteria bacterium]|nr:30S ribosomal protein S17 [Acidobacteriota bacterium]MBU4494820.1 30S ribosomal protein S17 [Acidobacteriota bacterium]